MPKQVYTRVKDTFDPRDHHYKRHLGLDAPLPQKADLRPYCSPVEDQGETSSCTGHAAIGAVEVDENFTRAITNDPFVTYSRLFVYYNERLIEGDTDNDAGGQIRDVIKSLTTYGVCLESVWPFNPEAVIVKPSLEAYAEAVSHKALAYESIPQSEDALLHCLAVTQRPIVFGIYIYESFETDDVANTGLVPMPDFGEKCLGGHAILIVGYDSTTRLFIVRNSWGPNWGDQGYFYLPFDYVLSAKLSEDFWVVSKIQGI